MRGQQRVGKKVDGRLCLVATCQLGCRYCCRKAGGVDVGAALYVFFGSAREFIGSGASFQMLCGGRIDWFLIAFWLLCRLLPECR